MGSEKGLGDAQCASGGVNGAIAFTLVLGSRAPGTTGWWETLQPASLGRCPTGAWTEQGQERHRTSVGNSHSSSKEKKLSFQLTRKKQTHSCISNP